MPTASEEHDPALALPGFGVFTSSSAAPPSPRGGGTSRARSALNLSPSGSGSRRLVNTLPQVSLHSQGLYGGAYRFPRGNHLRAPRLRENASASSQRQRCLCLSAYFPPSRETLRPHHSAPSLALKTSLSSRLLPREAKAPHPAIRPSPSSRQSHAGHVASGLSAASGSFGARAPPARWRRRKCPPRQAPARPSPPAGPGALRSARVETGS